MIDEEEKTMATDVKKMIRLVQERTAYGVLSGLVGICCNLILSAAKMLTGFLLEKLFQ